MRQRRGRRERGPHPSVPNTDYKPTQPGMSAEPATMPDLPRTAPPGGQWQRYDPQQPRFDRRGPEGWLPGFEPAQDPRQSYDPPHYPQPSGYGAWPQDQPEAHYQPDGRTENRGPFEPLQPPSPYPSAQAAGQPFPTRQPPTQPRLGMQPPGMQ